jgi:DNA excision repair protein ERCC-4
MADEDDSSANNHVLADEALIPEGVLPGYLAEAFGDLYEEDGILCFAKGLQWECLLAAFCRYYSSDEQQENDDDDDGDEKEKHKEDATIMKKKKQKKMTKRRPLVLILGLKDEGERSVLLQLLQSWGTPTTDLPTMITNESGQSKERRTVYETGGVLAITSRILIVDLLNGTVKADEIDGLLVAHAESVTDTSTEAFIIRIFSSQNSSGFIKAFTDAPDRLLSGFAKVDKILRNLRVRKLYLFPRFQASVRDELDASAIQVTELHQELSASQRDIQAAIAVLITQCTRQLKSATRHLITWDDTADVVTISDRAISQQLEPVWHRLRPATKQLLQDLRTLRTLLQSLLTFDCVSFYKFLNSLRTLSAASRHPSLWLLEPAAQRLVQTAENRVYTIQSGKLTAVLEENPKWKLLQDCLEEVRKKQKNQGTILVLVKDNKTMDTLRSYLTIGRVPTLRRKWLRLLEEMNDKWRSARTTAVSERSRLLIEEETRCRRLLSEYTSSRQKRKPTAAQTLNHIPKHIRQKRRVAAEKGRFREGDDLAREAVLEEAVEAMEHDEDDETAAAGTKQHDNRHLEDIEAVSLLESRVIMKSYADGELPIIMLQDIEPDCIVFYDTDLSFLRSVEVHASLSLKSICVYMLMAKASAEEKLFQTSLEREQTAFEKLIHHKQTMPEPIFHTTHLTQEMQQAGGSATSSYAGGTLPLAVDTRKMKRTVERRLIAVDVREFRSALPSILHQGGMQLAPVTLTVGDFILTSAHCIERKSISDLYGSFASGRLFTQVEAMAKYYSCPCLLIEFDPSKSFSLQNASDLGHEIKSDSISSRLAVLTLHCPKLRLLWSRGPHETLKLFKALKQNHDDVDVLKAVDIGKSESEEHLLPTDDDDDEVNEVARDILLRLPGVNHEAARRIVQEVDSLADLCTLSRDDLRRIVGPSNGQKLFTFLRQKMGATAL